MNFLIFDTETNGFPPKARMTQLAFMLVDEYGNELKTYETLIKPDGWVIPGKQYWLDKGYSEEQAIKKGGFFDDNNMSTERCEAKGIPVFEALRQFQDHLKLAHVKVAHNIAFDNKILTKEIDLAGITPELFRFKKGLCTMASTTNLLKLPGKYNSYKWPKLEELHRYLFNEDFEDAHDALADVRATKRCLIELIKRGILKV